MINHPYRKRPLNLAHRGALGEALKDALSTARRPYSVEIGLFVTAWVLYVVHVIPGGGVNPSRYFDLTHSLVNYGTIQIDAYHENTIDKAFRDGHYYSGGLPGPSLAGIPAYLSFKLVYRLAPSELLGPLSSLQASEQGTLGGLAGPDKVEFFLSTIWINWFALAPLSALGAVALFRLLLALGAARPVSLTCALIYSFGTPVFYHSTSFYSHVFAASAVLACLLWLVHLGPGSAPAGRRLAGLGFVAGLSLLMEYQGFFVVLCLGIYALNRWKWRGLAAYGLGAALPLLALLLYNTAAFGGPFHVPQEFLDSDLRQASHGQGVLGFTLPTPGRLLGLTVLPERGLFAYSPVLLLGPIGWIMALRRRDPIWRDLAWLSILASLCILLWVAAFEDWRSGFSFGPRYLIILLPFVLIGVAAALPRIPARLWLPLAVVSVVTNWLGAQYGFADDVFSHWRTFFQHGFTLPALSVILRHAGGANPIVALVREWQWAIGVVYIAGLALALAVLLRSVTGNLSEHPPARPAGGIPGRD